MSFEDELSRHLNAKGASLRSTPDVGDLLERVNARRRRARRFERFSIAGAVVLLAASLGGLAGALVNAPRAPQETSQRTGDKVVSPRQRPGSNDNGATSKHGAAPVPASPQVVIRRQLPDGFSVLATVQAFSAPVGITSEWSSATECATGEIVTTTVGQDGSFAGGMSVARLPLLGPDGLEVLSSGLLPVAGGGQEWWVATAVGSSVSRVAAEEYSAGGVSVGGSPVTVLPSSGVAVIAGPMTTTSGAVTMSAVAETSSGDTSLAFVLGSGPRSAGESTATTDASGCDTWRVQASASSASSSEPADPELAAGSIIAAFAQADDANLLLGFAANLAAVAGGDRLSTGSNGTAQSKGSTTGAGGGAAPSAGAGGVVVREVSFSSASTASVVYSDAAGVLYVGSAQLGSTGSWRVSLATFCSNVRAGAVGGEVPTGVFNACGASG